MRVSPGHLQGPEQPTLSELQAAFSLHRLSRAIAGLFCKLEVRYPADIETSTISTPEARDRMDEWWPGYPMRS
jgi:hypothetical protein